MLLGLFKPGRPTWTDTDRQILALAFPALGALVAEPLYILADTAVVGNLGTPQLGGLALASSLLLIAFAIFIFLAYGTTSAVARLLGAGEHRQAAHQAVQSVWLAFVLGVAISIALYAVRNPLIELLGGEGDVATNAEVYLRISLPGLPAMLIALAGVGYLRGLQDTKRPLYVALGTAVLNLVVEVVLIFGLDFGIGASALSTVIAQWVGAMAYLVWIARAIAEHGVGLSPDWRIIVRLAGAGADLLVRTAALRGGLTVTVAVAARLGDADLAAHEIAFQIWSALAFALDAVAIAAQAMIGHALGADDAAEAVVSAISETTTATPLSTTTEAPAETAPSTRSASSTNSTEQARPPLDPQCPLRLERLGALPEATDRVYAALGIDGRAVPDRRTRRAFSRRTEGVRLAGLHRWLIDHMGTPVHLT